MAQGKTNREIGQALNYSTGTAKLDVGHIMTKLGASNRREAAERAVEISRTPPR